MTGGGERGQSLVEAVAIMPLCLLCALALVDAGIVVRDRLATVQATGRAATAELAGRDAEDAALRSLPKGLRSGATVRVDNGEVVVATTSRPTMLRVLGGVDHRSIAQLHDDGEDGGAR